MKVRIIDNVSLDMASVLYSAIGQAKDVKMAVAFISQDGFSLVDKPINSILQKGSNIEFLIGLDMHVTEPKVLQNLFALSCKYKNLAIYCYASLSPGVLYHPKLYIFRNNNIVKAIVGSSNMTHGGLKKNIEANISIEASINDEIISDAYSIFNRLKFHPKRVIPDEEFIILYSELCVIEKKNQLSLRRDKSSINLLKTFNEKAKLLRRPIPTRKDLVGWLELVYDSLPEGEFTNKEIYSYEQEYQRRYPENLNIKAKIRQQLQILRSLGFLEHIGRASWRKL